MKQKKRGVRSKKIHVRNIKRSLLGRYINNMRENTISAAEAKRAYGV